MPSVSVRTGNPARLILETITVDKPDLLIVGPHRERGVVDALDGTIAQKAVSTRKCPLLMVQRPADAGYRNVVTGQFMPTRRLQRCYRFASADVQRQFRTHAAFVSPS
jgi:hypothetical protein